MGLLGKAVKTVKELTDLGYPESVAKKISDGLLPMDEASRQARADAMGMGPDMYRGHADGNRPRSNEDMWMTDDPDVAQTYAGGGEYYDEALDDYAIKQGQVTPLRHNANNLFEMDAKGQHFEDIYAERSDFPDFTDKQYEGAWSSGTDGISSSIKDEGTRQGSRFTNIQDDFDADGAFEASTVENVLGTRPDVKIRSTMAAFDPEYNGSNILGGATGTAGAAGLLAAGQSEDSEAGPALALAKGIDLDRLVGTWQKRVSREPDIAPETHLQNIMHDKGFVNYNDFAKHARKQDGGKNGDTYFNGLKPMLMDISKHSKVGKDKRLMMGLTKYAKTRFSDRKAAGKQAGQADPYSLLPVAGIGAAAASLAAPHIKDSGMISAPRSDGLAEFTQGARNLQQDLEGSPMGLMFPEGLVNYLETTNRRTEDPNAKTRLGALMDFL